MQSRMIFLLLAASVLCACKPAVTISGRATVVDGDSLEIDGMSIRLFGIDAPEGRQTCLRDGAVWRCGATAAGELRALVGTQSIVCTERDVDSYGRSVAVCSNGEIDLGSAMVRAGLALAYREFSHDYVDEEAEARAARRGLWASEFTAPWDWRRNSRQVEPTPTTPVPVPLPSERSAPSTDGDCLIKGNINRERERIYNVPGSSSYEQTRINPERGERWFCSEQEAKAAGWRAPRG